MELLRKRVEAELATLLATGLHDPDEALAALDDQIQEASPDPTWLNHLKSLAKLHEKKQTALERTWPKRTVNDQIDAAFRELNAVGIVALQNAGYTMGDGWADAVEAAHNRGGARGAVFYHGQDLERGLGGDGLMLAFGSINKDDATEEECVAATLLIGQEASNILRLHGLTIEWDGTAETRMRIPPFEWQKRRFTRPSGRDLLLFACDLEKRMAVLKTCRTVLGIDLATAKAGLDSLKPRTYRWDKSPPWVVKRGISHEEATRFAAALTEAGAEVEVR